MSKNSIIIIVLLLLIIFGAGYLVMSSPSMGIQSGETSTSTLPDLSATTTLTASTTTQDTTAATSSNATTSNPNIQITSLAPNALIQSPLTITGQARGNWFFEASFPVKLLDGNGKVIASGPVRATDDWMTTGFVHFTINLVYKMPTTSTGTLVFSKDNPSGLTQNDEKFELPIRFK